MNKKKKVMFHNGATNRKALVAGCDPDVGVTIVSEDDPGLILFCIRNPDVHLAMFKKEMVDGMSEELIVAWLKGQTEYFNSEFARLLDEIESGQVFDGGGCSGHKGGVPKSSCPFNG